MLHQTTRSKSWINTLYDMNMLIHAKSILLQSKKEISSNFLFRLGELHVVFSMLEALEKYINNSGLDQAFAEAAIYGSATTEQMKYGKHMKKSFEANTKLNVALFCVYMKRFVSVQLGNVFFFFFFLSGFSFTNIHEPQDCRGRGRHFFNSSLPLPPASQTMRH